ncbi:bifunctional demethylmenaquinone methyltransferase/2-methoxy-6-polyprenyl-1,4-benzoquinol methylase UbiE [Helicobacter sp. MIT 99-5507]|uniref:bifunctional demethylmenaquinone methyltransferase/2-methoxy-6-polyprenyl-1,4-benzoquinol methylase UbiE n=1 Tax=Helicobacter sp. MIT 99-5507 TaxID=152489 RepID=UPI000E1EA776|nr:bifunctional demethylmenaquinone methyltransferase/2-methoxy-6-polyprenyl-1,4-benzoquinol methylase UbiE [Helicobacter sp. MIT 99-5507]RDU58520.1 bifunctional demethylmenaquinone methyltransferase/2-methoxy-6-polyprenyl-1,4-benzoquinol methylase UbiE [Helicobacter sp. MIT 99-5507]
MQNKQDNIINMFDDIASNYDIANRILSFNVDTKWRKEACIKALNLANNNNLNIADIACGTGDMIINWLKFSKDSKILGIDPSINMLNIAKNKLPNEVKLIQGEAKDIAIDDEKIDILSIAYGLRNVVEIDKALSEFHRVLRIGGILVILEFTRKDNANIIDNIALFYTKHILPILGGLISKNYKAYKYLPDSIDGFLTLEELEEKLKILGFLVKVKKRYIANLCSLIIAQKVD